MSDTFLDLRFACQANLNLVHLFPLGAALRVIEAVSMTVIRLDDHRQKPDDNGYDGAACPCGEAWFTLRGEGAAFCMDRSGHITGYSGTLCCLSCGRPYSPA